MAKRSLMTSSTELRVSREAERNIDDILQYTLKTWGNGQAMTYYTMLWDAFCRIQTFPEIGKQASPDSSQVRELVLEYHTIVYRYRDSTVTILRIVNPRRR